MVAGGIIQDRAPTRRAANAGSFAVRFTVLFCVKGFVFASDLEFGEDSPLARDRVCIPILQPFNLHARPAQFFSTLVDILLKAADANSCRVKLMSWGLEMLRRRDIRVGAPIAHDPGTPRVADAVVFWGDVHIALI